MSQRETVRLDDDEEVPVAEPGFSEKEQAKVEESQRPRAPVLYEIIRLEGENELGRPAMSLWWSGFAAGISIGFSFLTEAALAALLPKAEWAHIFSALGYTTGFIMVILGRQQLFTENVLTAVLPVVARSKLSWFLGMLRLWGIVLAANIVGCLVFACAFAFLPIVNTVISSEMAGLVHTLMGNTALEMFAKGIAGRLAYCCRRMDASLCGWHGDFCHRVTDVSHFAVQAHAYRRGQRRSTLRMGFGIDRHPGCDLEVLPSHVGRECRWRHGALLCSQLCPGPPRNLRGRNSGEVWSLASDHRYDEEAGTVNVSRIR